MKFRKIILVLSLIFLFSACSSPKEENLINDGGSVSEGSEGMIPSYTNEEPNQINKDSISSNEKLIQTIGLELETKEYSNTIKEIESLVKSLGGYIQSSYIPRPKKENEYSNLEANLSVMIPTIYIDDFILKTGKTSNIVSEQREVYNVTDSYRDTETRINTLKAKELRLLDLLKESGTLADLLMIENELSNTRYEIERLESTILDYDKRIQYTQFNLIIREVYEFSPTEKTSLWERIVDGFTNNAQSFLRSLESSFVFILTTLPFILIQVILWCLPIILFIILYRRFFRNRPLFSFLKKFVKKDKANHKE